MATVVTALAFLPAVPLAAAKEYRVTQHADPAPNGCTQHDCSLREAIDAANAHAGADVVGLRGGNYKLSRANNGTTDEDANATGDLDVAGPVTIEHIGKGRSKIDADGLDRVLEVVGPGAPTKLLKLKIIGGANPLPDAPKSVGGGDGGGLVSFYSPLTLIKCAVIGNKARSGGGIETGGGLTLKQSVVSRNKTTASTGGGIYAYGEPTRITLSTITHNRSANAGAGVVVDSGALHMRKSTVSSNVADSGAAGVYLYTAPASTIDASTINNNVAKDSAAGGVDSDFSTLTMTNTTITANQADGDGGGVRLEAGTFTGNGLTIARNTADADANADGLGGGIHMEFAPAFNLANSIVGQNRAASAANDCEGTITSGGGNVVETTSGCTGLGGADVTGKDPKLEGLDTNGGPTRTMGLKKSSPAIGAAVKATATKSDQRGVKRDAHPDSGAFER